MPHNCLSKTVQKYMLLSYFCAWRFRYWSISTADVLVPSFFSFGTDLFYISSIIYLLHFGFRSLCMILLKFFLRTFPQWRNFQFCQELDKLGSSPRCSWCSLIHIFRYLPLVDYHCQGLGRCLLYRFHQPNLLGSSA